MADSCEACGGVPELTHPGVDLTLCGACWARDPVEVDRVVRERLRAERDEARKQVALMADSLNKASALAHDVHMGLIAERDAALVELEQQRTRASLAEENWAFRKVEADRRRLERDEARLDAEEYLKRAERKAAELKESAEHALEVGKERDSLRAALQLAEQDRQRFLVERDAARAERNNAERERDEARLAHYDFETTIDVLREALEFYAAADSYEMQNYEHAGVNARQTPDGKWCAIPAMQDAGKRAREALGK